MRKPLAGRGETACHSGQVRDEYNLVHSKRVPEEIRDRLRRTWTQDIQRSAASTH